MPSGSRGERWEKLFAMQAISRVENGHRKRKERARRTHRLKMLLTKGKLPYTPTIMSWLSVALNKPSSKITEDDVKAYLAAK